MANTGTFTIPFDYDDGSSSSSHVAIAGNLVVNWRQDKYNNSTISGNTSRPASKIVFNFTLNVTSATSRGLTDGDSENVNIYLKYLHSYLSGSSVRNVYCSVGLGTDSTLSSSHSVSIPITGTGTYTLSEAYLFQNSSNYGTEFLHNADGTFYDYALDPNGLRITFDGDEVIETSEYDAITLEPLVVLTTVTTASNAYVGDEVTLYFNKNVSSYTHTVTYSIGGINGIITTQSPYTSLLWTIPSTIINGIATDSTHGTLTITCQTYDGSGVYWGSTTTTMTVRLDVNESAPTFDPVVKDVNPITLALTGDENKVVRYFSNLYIEVGAVAKDNATIAKQSASCGGQSFTTATGTLNAVESGDVELTATDSRGFTSKQTVNKVLIPYSKLSANVFTGTINVRGEGQVQFEGNYFNSSFGAVNNDFKLEYRVKEGDDGTYGDWITVSTETPSTSGYSFTLDLTGLNYKELYTYQTRVTDKLMVVTSAEVVMGGYPIFDWGRTDFNFNVPVTMQEHLRQANGASYYGKTADDEEILALSPCDSTNSLTLGYGGYTSEIGSTKIYGNEVNIFSNGNVTINDRVYGQNNVLWSGASHMNESQSITLSEAVSSQPNGIVLVFSLYRNEAAEDVSINSFFVSKKEVELLPGCPHTFMMAINAGLSTFGAKYLYIDDSTITGHEGNTTSAAGASGITVSNSMFVLRYVIGV